MPGPLSESVKSRLGNEAGHEALPPRLNPNSCIPSTAAIAACEDSAAHEWKSVSALAAETAESLPDRVAIVDSRCRIGTTGGDGELRVSYRELNARADQIAAELRAIGLSAGDVVALRLPRSIGLAAGALGAFKAGAAYLPINPQAPASQAEFELDDASARAIVTSAASAGCFNARGRTLILLDEAGRIVNPCSRVQDAIGAPDVLNGPEGLAYIIYTSGSTGKPKGVEITHSNLANLVRWHQAAFDLRPSDRMNLLANVEFDASVWEMWPVLCTGASLHIPDDVTKQDPQALREWLIDRGITISFVPTPTAERLISQPWPHSTQLRTLLTGGDTLHVRPRASIPFRVVNNYGPTECAVVATSGEVELRKGADGLPTIGKPITNVTIHILDEQLRPVAEGEEGEICIGGAGVARGYRNQPELTRTKFIADPFRGAANGRLYRSGDLGRWLPNGEVAFLGRMDSQVKIRGFRIELDAIASVLDEHPWVKQSAVSVRDFGEGDRRLVAYIVSELGVPITHFGLREHVATRLPQHMIPAVFVVLDELPLNSSGKVDRNALPEPNESNRLSATAYLPPRTATEQRVTDLVGPLLGVDRVSVQDNFFMLGGHSLLGTQLIARMRATFGVELNLRTLFECPTIAALAAEVDRLVLIAAAQRDETAVAPRSLPLQ